MSTRWIESIDEALQASLATEVAPIDRVAACNAALDRIGFESREYAPLVSDLKREYDLHVAYHETKQRFRRTQRLRFDSSATNTLGYTDEIASLNASLAGHERERRYLSARNNWLLLFRLLKQSRNAWRAATVRDRTKRFALGLTQLISRIGPTAASDPTLLQIELDRLAMTYQRLRDKAVFYRTAEQREQLCTALHTKEAELGEVQAQLTEVMDRMFAAEQGQATRIPLGRGDDLQQQGGPLMACEDLPALSNWRVGIQDEVRDTALNLLEWEDRFAVAFTSKRFAVASRLAAQCPDWLLRTPETWRAFRQATKLSLSNRMLDHSELPIFLYCAALIDAEISEAEVVECASTALQHERLDVLEHWVATNKLPACEGLASLLASQTGKVPDPKGVLSKLTLIVCQRLGTPASFDLGVKLLMGLDRPHAAVRLGSQNGLGINDMLRHVSSEQTHGAEVAASLGRAAVHSNGVSSTLRGVDPSGPRTRMAQGGGGGAPPLLVDVVAGAIAEEVVSVVQAVASVTEPELGGFWRGGSK